MSPPPTQPGPGQQQPPLLPKGYTLHPSLPPASTYCHLRKSAGLTPVTEAQASVSIAGTWFGCCIIYRDPAADAPTNPTKNPFPEKVVAMGRVIGDGGWYFHIADMAVLPSHQRKGLGGVVLGALLGRVQGDDVPKGEKFVSLFADPPGRRLYSKNGFVDAAPKELGMMKLLD